MKLAFKLIKSDLQTWHSFFWVQSIFFLLLFFFIYFFIIINNVVFTLYLYTVHFEFKKGKMEHFQKVKSKDYVIYNNKNIYKKKVKEKKYIGPKKKLCKVCKSDFIGLNASFMPSTHYTLGLLYFLENCRKVYAKFFHLFLLLSFIYLFSPQNFSLWSLQLSRPRCSFSLYFYFLNLETILILVFSIICIIL